MVSGRFRRSSPVPSCVKFFSSRLYIYINIHIVRREVKTPHPHFKENPTILGNSRISKNFITPHPIFKAKFSSDLKFYS